MCTHLLLRGLQNYNSLLNVHTQCGSLGGGLRPDGGQQCSFTHPPRSLPDPLAPSLQCILYSPTAQISQVTAVRLKRGSDGASGFPEGSDG